MKAVERGSGLGDLNLDVREILFVESSNDESSHVTLLLLQSPDDDCNSKHFLVSN